MTRSLGWLTITILLAPVGYAGWVSFTPDSFLAPPTGDWSLRWYRVFAANRQWTTAAVRSLIVAAGAAGVAVIAGVPLALAVTGHSFRGRNLLATFAVLPGCVPPAVLGLGLLPVYAAVGLSGSLFGLILAHAMIGLPVVFLIARGHLGQSNPDLEAAARGLGATGWQTAVRVTLPLIRPAVLAGAAAAFVGSLNESMLSVFLSAPSSETLPVVAWRQLRQAANPLVAVASSASVVMGMVAGLLVMWLARPTR